MKIILFGANGQDGHYLTDLLLQQGADVIGIGREENVLSDHNAVSALIKDHKPDFIFHFAANSTTRHEAVLENHATIATGSLYILEAVKNFSPTTKVFISGSGLQFANNNEPIKETDQFEARDPYSVSRIQSVYAARYYRRLGLKIYVGYFFNHDSPLRSERHMSKKISETAKRIAAGSNEKLEIGDINVKKEWAFAGDITQAVWAFVNQDDVNEAVIGSGISYSIEDWLDACFSLINKRWQDHVIIVPGFIAEYQKLVCDPTTIKRIGWKPVVSFPMLAQMMMQ